MKSIEDQPEELQSPLPPGPSPCETGKFVEAISDVSRAADLAPTDKAIPAELVYLRGMCCWRLHACSALLFVVLFLFIILSSFNICAAPSNQLGAANEARQSTTSGCDVARHHNRTVVELCSDSSSSSSSSLCFCHFSSISSFNICATMSQLLGAANEACPSRTSGCDVGRQPNRTVVETRFDSCVVSLTSLSFCSFCRYAGLF